ncbi:hypothetical protein K2X89_10415 [Myxococcota bacterium]|nr:hypothetical protein [Myxococcota bacterium]
MRRSLQTLCISLIVASSFALGAPARAVLINFDAPADGTLINTYYPSVTFSNPLSPFNVHARAFAQNTSPGNVVSIFPTGSPAFYAAWGAVDGTINAGLLEPVLTVTVMAGAAPEAEPLATSQNRPFMEVWDRSNNFLGKVLFQGPLPATTTFQRLTFSVPPCPGPVCFNYGIGRVRLSSQQTQPPPRVFAVFDDFQWNPPVCGAPVLSNGNGSACAGTINTDTCANWTCNAGFERTGSNPVCSEGTWTGTYACTPVIGTSYYNTDGDASRMFIVSPSATATPVTTFSQAYPIAVRRTVLLGQIDEIQSREFTLAGAPTGLAFAGPQAFSQLLDGTTDGVQWNYGIECCGPTDSVVRSSLMWTQSTRLFDLPGVLGGGAGIAYDTRRNHLFVSVLGDLLIREYDLVGRLQNTFAVFGVPGQLIGLAYDQGTDTLWGKTATGSTLYQFTRDGTLLKTVPVAGLNPSNDFGGEMRIRPMLDFQGLERVASGARPPFRSYSEDGFTLTASSLSSFGTLDGRYSGSTALFETGDGAVVELRHGTGSAFDLVSIDLAEREGPDATTVTFTGDLQGGGTVTQSFTLDGVAFGAQIFKFGPQFTNLTAVRWSQDAPYHQFDNIVAEVPEPAFGALMLTGTLGLVAAHARRGAGRRPDRLQV